MSDWKTFAGWIILALLALIALNVFLVPANAYYYVEQGSTIYLNETVDISGIASGVENLAYYGGFDEESGTQFLLEMPATKKGYYNFYIDPKIFTSRLGKWYKWNGEIESHGNTLAFVVASKRKPILNETENETLQNPEQIPIELPKVTYLPKRHVSDYLIAKGNGFSLPVNGKTSVWIFGFREGLYDYQAFNGTVDITPDAINTLSEGVYTVLLLTQEPGYESVSTVKYNDKTGMLEWFDPVSFGINQFYVVGQTPENILKQIQEISATAHTKYTMFNLEVQTPSITINQIDSLNALNVTGTMSERGIALDQPGYIDVRGYTNAEPDTIIRVVVDPVFQADNDLIWKNAIITKAEGEVGGDMRQFKAIIPVDKYDMAPGRHFVVAKTDLSDAYVTADFYLYENPTGNFIPNKTIRYISGRYGPEEMVPTPTPITVIKEVPGPTRLVTVPVTPSNEQVYAQQKLAQDKINDENWVKAGWVLVIGGGLALVGMGIRYAVKVYRKARQC